MLKLCLVFFVFGLSRQAFSFSIVEYLKSYNLGFNLIGAAEFAKITYESSSAEARGKDNCQTIEAVTKCTVSTNNGTAKRPFGGVGVFIEHPFSQNSDLFFWKLDLSFAAQILDGQLAQSTKGSVDTNLESLSYSLRGLQVRPFAQFGITPRGFPDVVFTGGPVGTLLAGTVRINDQKEQVKFIQRSQVSLFKAAHYTLEIIFVRFREGAFSLYWSRSLAPSTAQAGSFYSGTVGTMSNFSAEFIHKEVGFKWLLNWP